MAYLVQSEHTQEVVAILAAAKRQKVVAVLLGEPGTGKTALIEAVTAIAKSRLIKVLLGSLEPSDAVGLPVRTEVSPGEWVTSYAPPSWAREAIDAEEGATLFFDEFSSGMPAVQAAFLTPLQSRQITMGPKLPDHVWMVAAANPEDSAADGWTFPAPTANRLLHINWNPPQDDWFRGMIAGWGETVSAREAQLRGEVVAFLRQNVGLVHAMPAGAAERGGAWPSRRSWDNLVRVVADIDLTSPDALRSAEARTIKGLVGAEAATDFTLFREGYELPEAEKVVADPSIVAWGEEPVDKIYAILGSAMAYGMSHDPDGLLRVFTVAGEEGPADAAAALVVDLYANWRRVTGRKKLPNELIPVYEDLLVGAGVL